ncbi:MAG: diguanylate cyclase [Candidatus Omnitrophica bacterium]|nr:diguanylate cyclase [Candidatus Omnitrophota bacterium]
MDKTLKILVVDDEPDLVLILTKRISEAGYEVVCAENGIQALSAIKNSPPDLIVLDIMMPGMGGLELKRILNEDPTTADIPVIFLSAKAQVENKVEGLRLKADDYMTKPFEAPELLVRIESILARRDHYEKIATTDGLTGLANAAYCRKQMKLFFDIAKRYRRGFALAVLDIDNLKFFNDQYGHKAGDRVISIVAGVIREKLRKSDFTARYGGDEFVILFPESTEMSARKALALLRAGIDAAPLLWEDQSLAISVSAGVAAYQEQFRDESELFEAADRDMYREKKSRKK